MPKPKNYPNEWLKEEYRGCWSWSCGSLCEKKKIIKIRCNVAVQCFTQEEESIWCVCKYIPSLYRIG